ncbi:MAG: hypothetical protein HYR67_13380 [Bacteroidetes bacterium]|nr:hypothetical protein [Bacteroidota bacterium]
MLAGNGKKFYEFFIQLVLIIVGVLSALAVDNYRESIQERKTEKEYLINLRNSVQSDTALIRTEIQRIYSKINAISELIALSNSSATIDNEKFGDLITDVIMLIRPNFITAVYEELKFTGNFKLIRNNELKLLIISYYSDNALLQEQNDRDLGIYTSELIDVLTFDELEYKTPFDQKRIFKAIQQRGTLMNELIHSQKRATIVRTGLIYTSLPRSIELLEKLQSEIDK